MGVEGLLVIMSLKEDVIIHLPLSLMYQFCLSFEQIGLFYQKSGVKAHIEYVFNNELYVIF